MLNGQFSTITLDIIDKTKKNWDSRKLAMSKALDALGVLNLVPSLSWGFFFHISFVLF